MEKNNKLMQKNIKYFFNSQFYPKNVVQPQCRGRSKMTLNTINECIIITHAHGFVPVKKYWGDGCLAAPQPPWHTEGARGRRSRTSNIFWTQQSPHKTCTSSQAPGERWRLAAALRMCHDQSLSSRGPGGSWVVCRGGRGAAVCSIQLYLQPPPQLVLPIQSQSIAMLHAVRLCVCCQPTRLETKNVSTVIQILRELRNDRKDV